MGLKRIDTKYYLPYSLRESLFNAVIHQSYYFNSSIFVTLYDNRFEIVLMGGLINGITIKEIFKGISSNIFYRLGYVESYGTWIGRIMDSYNDFYKKTHFWYNRKYIFYNITYEKIIIDYIKDYNKINRNDLEKILNISKTSAYKMLNKNIISKKGNGKNTCYILK